MTHYTGDVFWDPMTTLGRAPLFQKGGFEVANSKPQKSDDFPHMRSGVQGMKAAVRCF